MPSSDSRLSLWLMPHSGSISRITCSGERGNGKAVT
jgi:hypothetical protein